MGHFALFFTYNFLSFHFYPSLNTFICVFIGINFLVQYSFPGYDLFYFLNIPFPSLSMCPIPPFSPISFSSFLSTTIFFYCCKTPFSSSQTCFPTTLVTLTYFEYIFCTFYNYSFISLHSTLWLSKSAFHLCASLLTVPPSQLFYYCSSFTPPLPFWSLPILSYYFSLTFVNPVDLGICF